MTYYLGVDLGTTFTSAGVFRDSWVSTVALSNHEASTKSVVFAKEDGTILIGDTAARRGVTDPERVGREFKRRVGDPQPLFLGGSPYSAEQLTSRLLRFVLERSAEAEGEPPSGVAISHPANWGPYKIDLLRQATQMAGLPDSTVFLAEPEAAAIFYAEDARLQPGETIAVYDLGGGTFDAAVLRKTKDGFEFLGPPAGIERLGGIDFDAAVFAHVTHVLGASFSSLDPEDSAAIAGVARLREDCTLAREGLSDDTTVTIPVLLPGVTSEVRLTRSEYEAMIRPALAETVEALKRAVAAANVQVTDLHAVLLVGGCSRTPLVSQMISAELGCPVALCPDLIHAVALGGAHAAARANAAAAPAPEIAPPSPPTESTDSAPTPPMPPIAPSSPPALPRVDSATKLPAQHSSPQAADWSASPEWSAPTSADPPLAHLHEEVGNDNRRIAALVGAGLGVLALIGLGLFLNGRGNSSDVEAATEAAGDSQAIQVESATTLPDEQVTNDVGEAASDLVIVTIDKGSMVGVDSANPTIGTNAERSTQSPPEFAPERTVDGQIVGFVDRNVTSNVQFYDFASFTSVVSDGDPLETWLSLVPDSWLTTTSELPTNFADLGIPAQESVVGVSWQTADRYCNYALKRMPTEIEWELAATEGLFDFSDSQNWVSGSETYGSIPTGATVVRGSSGPDDSSPYHRTISPGGDGIPQAGIRCAADGVNEIARPSGELLYSRIFGGDEEPRDWPDLHDPDNTDVVFGYHSPDVFHIETVAPTSTVVSSGETHDGNTEVSMEVELRKPKDVAGSFRYGLMTRASSAGALLFMVSPNVDQYGGLELTWCARIPAYDLIGEGWIYGIETTYDTPCAAEGTVSVDSFRNNISVRFVDGTAEFFIDGEMVDSMTHGLKLDGEFGVILEAFEGDPKIHIHYDNLVVKTS